jgi:hypothetical protein
MTAPDLIATLAARRQYHFATHETAQATKSSLTAVRAAHQQLQVFQVIVQKSRPAPACGGVQIQFVARHNADRIPTVSFSTPRGRVDVYTPEATAFNFVGYPERAEGLDKVATTLVELLEGTSPERLAAAAPLSPVPCVAPEGAMCADCSGFPLIPERATKEGINHARVANTIGGNGSGTEAEK